MKLLILSFAFFATSLSNKTATTVSTNDTTLSYPCHPNGDLYPCTHPKHPSLFFIN